MRNVYALDKRLNDINLLSTQQLETVEEEFFNKVTQLLNYEGQKKAVITSAVLMTNLEKTRMKQVLTKIVGQSLDTEFRVQESILGGFRIHIGDLKLDASLTSQLTALHQHLIS